ncbi:protein NRT1/ PTR FAMILY 8.4 isoform X2 [Oryza sativa Japonica Group]|uniref:Os03g0235900 protein n=1 Tax=Oryza sativa subsp. japonica TaxID=39947 RepID=Q10PF8_ORYSJ|nr:protein NRT1/ PTR FAMILY 8.4 isoform X2 [Oryza sativa Japonica Group]XP_015632227.1 protein NRT1/ PTR FAMILY 8.4 isoform X2 [Oryza sativa Japonica Group]KAB8090971.1 hypothetical protein EE612_016354 [Oryza sativa]ABF94838.1 POT family protein, expressed [Oryza sativa Japonica Group]BAG90179.1 unnamed protein product [Oryza sativa Japonica Group]BAS83146.1 Os03g0235900 [Oryza sativa Japonica Group]
MDSSYQHDKPLLDEENSSQVTLEYTGDGSVCIRGHPALRKHTGNWKGSSLAIVFSFCSYLAFTSIVKNLVSYLTKVLHETNVAAARDVATWSGTSYLAPLVGAFLADSYLGKYCTILIFCTIFIIGLMMLLLSAAVPLISTGPHSWIIWTDPVSSQNIIFFVGLYMVALGYGAQCPCISSFGADQFDDTDENERTKKSSFFNWTYFVANAGSLISGTVIVWVQDHKDFRNLEEALLREYARLLLLLFTNAIKICHVIPQFFMSFWGRVQQSKAAENWSIQLDLSSLIELQW